MIRANIALVFVLLLAAGVCGCTQKPAHQETGETENNPNVLKVGMIYQAAIEQLGKAGAEVFVCSYGMGMQFDPNKPSYTTWGWYTLPDGLSVWIIGDKENKSDALKITGLKLCNSTMLFCCKGESWYRVDSINLANGKSIISGLKGNKIHKGMEAHMAAAVIKRANLTQLDGDANWLCQFPERGRWLRYALPEKMELILNIEQEGEGEFVRLILVEATVPAEQDEPEKMCKVECELLDLDKPLREDWCWAFGEGWEWKPGEEDRHSKTAKRGQAR